MKKSTFIISFLAFASVLGNAFAASPVNIVLTDKVNLTYQEVSKAFDIVEKKGFKLSDGDKRAYVKFKASAIKNPMSTIKTVGTFTSSLPRSMHVWVTQGPLHKAGSRRKQGFITTFPKEKRAILVFEGWVNYKQLENLHNRYRPLFQKAVRSLVLRLK